MPGYNVVCPSCDRVNRIPHERPAHSAKCGQCGEKLFAGRAIALNGERFRHHIGRSEVPVVADFWATWCVILPP
jgi:thioredoxin 2